MTGLIVGLCYMGAAPFAAYWLFARRMKLEPWNVALGVAVFFVYFKAIPFVSGVLAEQAAEAGFGRYGLFVGGLAAAVIVAEALRFVALRLAASRSIDAATGVAFGIGYGACEIVTTLMVPQIHLVGFAMRLSSGDLSLGSSESMVRALAPALSDGIGKGVVGIVMILVEIAVSTLVWIGVRDRAFRWIVGAVALHALYLSPLIYGLGASRAEAAGFHVIYHEILGLLLIAGVALGSRLPLGASKAANGDRDPAPASGLFGAWSSQRRRGDGAE